LTSEALSQALMELIAGSTSIFMMPSPRCHGRFAGSPKIFQASRYDETGIGDYLNCPLSETEYLRFHEALLAAEKVTTQLRKALDLRRLPAIEVMAERGSRTLTFGP
jgi:methylenetetrahydrofolate--tRNA-(uracil-5-)-methyltransferase